MRNEWIIYWLSAILTCSINIYSSSLELITRHRDFWLFHKDAGENICGALEFMSHIVPRSWNLTYFPLTEDIIWLVRQLKREEVSTKKEVVLYEQIPRREWQRAPCEPARTPGTSRTDRMARRRTQSGPPGASPRPFPGQLFCLQNPESYAFKEGPVISYYLLFLCISLCTKGEAKAIKNSH